MPAYSNPSSEIGGDSARGPEHLRQRLQLATGGLAESPVLDFLETVTDPPDQQVATNLWRLAAVKPPPFVTQFITAEAFKSRQLWREREQPFRVGAWCFGVVNRPVTRGIHH